MLTDNEFGGYLRKNSLPIVNGRFRGKLFDVGEYPAAVLDNESQLFVYGSVVELIDESVLKTIDPYEGYGEDQPQPYLYLRELVDIETEGGILTCWTYLYNHPTEKLKPITSGNYLNYIQ